MIRKPLVPGPCIAIDSESTEVGPFAVSMCNDQGQQRYWEWPVHPLERHAIIPPEDITLIQKVMRRYKHYVFHNSPHDIPEFEKVGILSTDAPIDAKEGPLNTYEVWSKLEDTLAASHVLYSDEAHGLKPLCQFLGISETDKKLLQEDTIKARRIAKSYNLQLKKQGLDPEIKVGEAVYSDYWLSNYLIKKRIAKKSDFEGTCEDYAVLDAIRTMKLWIVLYGELQDSDLWGTPRSCYLRENGILEIVWAMRKQGIRIFPTRLDKEIATREKIEDSMKAALRAMARKHSMKDFNANSAPQKAELLFTRLRLKAVKYTAKGGNPSTDSESLTTILETQTENKEGIRTIKSLQKLSEQGTVLKYLRSYKNLYRKRGNSYFIFPYFNPSGTEKSGIRTTRFSSDNPNAQNISKRNPKTNVRGIFGPPKGYVWYCMDYSQLEARILAVRAKEKSMLEVFKKDGDVHSLTQRLIIDMTGTDIGRGNAKNCNYMVIYGGGKAKQEAMTGIHPEAIQVKDATDTQHERFNDWRAKGIAYYAYQKTRHTYVRVNNRKVTSKDFLYFCGFGDIFRVAYPGITHLYHEVERSVKKDECVYTMFGYKLQVDVNKWYKGVNYVIQGTAGDILKNAMLDVYDYLYEHDIDDIRMIMTIHDELVIECRNVPGNRKHMKALHKLMESAGKPIGVHTPVDVGLVKSRWDKATPVTF